MAKPQTADSAPTPILRTGGIDLRQHARVQTCNLISYACLDEEGLVIKQGMGRALDISQNGLLLECGAPVESPFISLMSAGPDDRLIEIRGKVVHSRRTDGGAYRVGIQFTDENSDGNIRFAANLIKSFHYRRRKPA
jgi:c-di-GMP-binding flagellar brake protein YcgR